MPAAADETAAVGHARAQVLARIAAAAGRVGRDPRGVRLVAVSKTVPVERLRAAVAAGLTELGENRVQEAESKAGLLDGVTWHLVGPLQSNKARRAVALFAMIQSVDSVDLARRLDRISAELRPGAPLPVLLQVNVDRDPAKAGFSPEAVAAVLPELLALDSLRIHGLMTIGRLTQESEEARPAFVALRHLGEQLRAAHPSLGPELSMGMTDDFEVAVEEGATIVRVGRALFGERPENPGA